MNMDIENQNKEGDIEMININTSREYNVGFESKSIINISNFPVYLKWSNIHYEIEVKEKVEGSKFKKISKPKVILDGVSGFIQKGQVLVIIGSSGAGKTTLLDILANRTKTGKMEGDLILNGESLKHKSSKRAYKSLSGYVYQDDCLKETLTVRETLMFYANLQLGDLSMKQKIEKVENLIDDLGLRKVANTRIGNEKMRGVSGGERKRVAIGVQLIRDPSILFLDEPTSGLDAFNSLSLMQLLNELAVKGKRTIITTLHQPRSTIFDMVDQLMILDAGKTVYFGPAKQAAGYFDRYLGFPVPEHINPADFFIDVVCGPIGKKKGIDYNSIFRESPFQTSLNNEMEKERDDFKKISEHLKDGTLKKYSVPFHKQLYYCLGRSAKDQVRNPMTSFVLLFQAIFMGLLIGSIYFGIDLDQASVQNRVGVLFFLVINQAFGMIFAIDTFLSERTLFNRERSASMYSLLPYFISKFICEVPTCLVSSFLTGTIAYWMTKLNNGASQYFTFLGIIFLSSNVAAAMLNFIGCVSPSKELASILAPIIIVLFFLFGGFFLNKGSIPKYYIWIHYISFFKYGFEALMTNEATGLVFNCKDSEKINGVCPIANGQQLLRNLDFNGVVVWRWCLVLLAFFFLYKILGYIALKFLHKEKR